MAVERVLSLGNFDRTSTTPRPTILVVTPATFLDQLKDALVVENKQNCSDMLQFILCEHVEEILNWKSQLSRVDYIVIVLDPSESTAITTAEDNLSLIDPSFINSGRLCFVNGACHLRPQEMGVPLGQMNSMSQKYSVLLINGDVLDSEKSLDLAGRIIRLISIVVGYTTGAPLSVDIPGYF